MSQTPWWPTLWTAIGVYDCPELTQPGKVHRAPPGLLGSCSGGSEWQLLECCKGLRLGVASYPSKSSCHIIKVLMSRLYGKYAFAFWTTWSIWWVARAKN